MTLLMPRRARVSWEAPWYSAGYSIAPTPMIVPWPGISRGTEWTVPMVPGLVREIVVPAKSSTASLPARAWRTIVLVGRQNWRKSIVSASLMVGTRSWRAPSLFCQVDGQAEVDVLRLDQGRLAVHLGVGVVHLRQRP